MYYPLFYGAGITLCELYMREREIQLAEREKALLELEKDGEGVNSGHKLVRLHGSFLNYTTHLIA